MSDAQPRPGFWRLLTRRLFALFGWRTRVERPLPPSYVLIGAPHTSNWDFVVMLFMMTIEDLPIRWMGKDSVFNGPLGGLFRAMGGIPVNRRERTNLVDQVAALFQTIPNLVIGIAPEGTRSKTETWKTGFYYIALKARVPIVLGYADYASKTCGLGPSFTPSGNIQADFEIIRQFYSTKTGKHPARQGHISLAPRPPE